MVIGTGIVAACLYFKRVGEPVYFNKINGSSVMDSCLNSESNLWVGGVIYASYLYLFAEFAVRRFCSTNEAAKAKSTKTQ
jgi:hypothetical protein